MPAPLLDADVACREMPTRRCPIPYGSCGERSCARFEADENDPELRAVWLEHWRIIDAERD
jgi:hypothetical protein